MIPFLYGLCTGILATCLICILAAWFAVTLTDTIPARIDAAQVQADIADWPDSTDPSDYTGDSPC